jgi:hypothetical protein
MDQTDLTAADRQKCADRFDALDARLDLLIELIRQNDAEAQHRPEAPPAAQGG